MLLVLLVLDISLFYSYTSQIRLDLYYSTPI